MFDAKHGIYHLFFQDHLAMPSFNGSGAGPVYGHAASKDLAHWARLPVAIWNDHRYDSVAIYTGVCQPDIHTPTDCCPARVDWC